MWDSRISGSWVLNWNIIYSLCSQWANTTAGLCTSALHSGLRWDFCEGQAKGTVGKEGQPNVPQEHGVYRELNECGAYPRVLFSGWVLLTSLYQSRLTVGTLSYINCVLSFLAVLNELKGWRTRSQPSLYPMSYKWHFILICRFPAPEWIIYKVELVGSNNQLPEIYTHTPVSALLLRECEVSHCPGRYDDFTGTGTP